MSREVAETLRRIGRDRRSLIVLAVPRLAGKSTVLRAILAERPPTSPVMTLAEDGQDVDELVKKSIGGYLVIPEITQSAAMPGYIWGDDVRRIFKAAKTGVSLAATLHADGPGGRLHPDLPGLRGPRRRRLQDRVLGSSAFDRPLGGTDTPCGPGGSRDRRRRGR